MTSARGQSTDLAGAFSRFERSAFRLETLDRYTVPDEAEPYRRFLADEPQDPAWREPWAGYVREQVIAGKSMTRVRVLDEPLTDYLRFELTAGYPANVEAGEDIRVLRRTAHPGLDIVEMDFWLFDDREIALMNYGPAGEFHGASVTSEPASSIEGFCRHRDKLWEYAVPLAEYLAIPGVQ